MYNKITLMGRIVSIPELKTTSAGVPVTSFTIAVDRRYKAKDETRKSDFFKVVCWRSSAEYVCKYFTKGSVILVEGEMQSHRYPDKSGKELTWYEVQAERVCSGGRYTAHTDDAPYIPEIKNFAPEDNTFSDIEE